MSDLDRLKQRLVGDAIRDNVELIAGRRRVPDSRPRRQRALRVLGWSAGILGLATAAAFALVWTGSRTRSTEGEPRDTTVASVTTGTGELAALPAAATDPLPLGLSQPLAGMSAAPSGESPERRFTAPAPLDPAALPLGVRRIVLDPGHGGRNPGTASGGLREKDITLDLALRLRPLLELAGYEVALTRETDTDIDLAERVAAANERRGDLFVSIHVNWLGRGAARGIETFYLGPTDDPVLTRLTSEENQESGYSLTDFRRLLDGIYEDVRHDESRSLAESVHRSLYQKLRTASPGLKDRGVKTAPFVVLIGNEMPAVLAEVGSLSDRQDVELFADEEYRLAIVEALRDGIVAYALSRATPAARIASTGAAANTGG
jgi:N-acetylmuramoyl-L-alanine amidase